MKNRKQKSTHPILTTISSCCSFCYSFPVLVHQQIHFSRVVIVLYIPFCILFGLIVLEAIPTLQSAIQHQTFPTLRPRMGQLSMQKSLSCSIRCLAPVHLNLHLLAQTKDAGFQPRPPCKGLRHTVVYTVIVWTDQRPGE